MAVGKVVLLYTFHVSLIGDFATKPQGHKGKCLVANLLFMIVSKTGLHRHRKQAGGWFFCNESQVKGHAYIA